ncbi:hypothetical protein ACFV3R_03160 [Streptomyces sp. NPDC059740]|uniref:hypothetical protein n=1 Tax=Streptomyces sp. NPDC059740 TaxID=3346926 RepID=UPI0036595AB5
MRRLVAPGEVLRRGYTAAREARTRWAGLVTVPPAVDDWPRLTPAHLSLLDGRTLNVCVRVPDQIRPTEAHLVIGGGAKPVVAPLTLTERGEGRVEASGTLVVGLLDGRCETVPALPTDLRRYLLAAGQWKLSVRFADGTGEERRFALAAVPNPLPDGPTIAAPTAADGSHGRLLASSTGRAHLSLGRDAAAAEVERVVIGWSDLTLHGRLTNAASQAYTGASVELVRRGGAAVRSVQPAWDGEHFTCRLRVEDFAGATAKEQIWDVRLTAPGGRPLKVSRRHTDVRLPKQVFRMPNRLLADEQGRCLRINPYYTPVGSLALRGAVIASEREQ